jgi:hypothetical protein
MTFPVAVGAANLAFADFCFDLLPGITDANHPADRHAFFSANMVEVKATRIGFPTINARM